MSFLHKILNKTRMFSVMDFSMLKISIFAFTLGLAKLVPAVVSLDLWIYVVVFAFSYIWVLVKVLK